MTFGSLFSGIGGMDLGLERAGMECRWQVEIDPFCQKVLAKHWPNVKRYGDITKLEGSELEAVDLIAGGFPCQDVSRVGSRNGIDGKRSGLWTEYIRLVRFLRPRYVLVENVAGLLDGGIGRVLGDLARCGYDAEWDMLPAFLFGLPHRRERVFIVAYSRRPIAGTIGIGKLCDGQKIDWERLVLPRRGRNPYGIPDWVDRVAAIGNAVAPDIAEWIGRRITEANGTRL